MTMQTILDYCGNRLFEWVMTVAMLLLAIHVFIWPQAIGASAFRYILWIIGPTFIALFFLIAGVGRVAALLANGSWPYWGPKIRAAGACLAALLWGQMCLALVVLIPEVGTPPSPGIPVYFALTLGEFFACYRVLANVRNGS